MTDAEDSEFLHLDCEAAHLLGVAYDQAIASIAEANFDHIPAKRIRDLIAMQIIECAREGERDPEKLRQRALAALLVVLKLDGPVPSPVP
jgi:hypothetical protein